MTTQDILELAARCEAASADEQRELIWEAAIAVRVAGDLMREMFEAGAFLDAAMTLVPEGLRRIEFGTYEAGGAWAYVWSVPTDEKGEADAATEALALTAAALKARAHTKGEE